MEFYWCTSSTWFDLLNDRIIDVEHLLAGALIWSNTHKFETAVPQVSVSSREGGLSMQYQASSMRTETTAISKFITGATADRVRRTANRMDDFT